MLKAEALDSQFSKNGILDSVVPICRDCQTDRGARVPQKSLTHATLRRLNNSSMPCNYIAGLRCTS
jgi:hypothetical protein